MAFFSAAALASVAALAAAISVAVGPLGGGFNIDGGPSPVVGVVGGSIA
jgi:hypothetical protein